MARNIEIKAKLPSIEATEALAAGLATAGPERIEQDDTFFRCARGRLKLRRFNAEQGELIFYRRPDQPGPKTSYYRRSATAEPDALRQLLAEAHGIVGRVIKQRTLYLAGRTRIHIDRVQGLGDYLELEVVLASDEDEAGGIAEAQALMARLGITAAQLIDDAYVDQLAAFRDAGAQNPATTEP